jgi:patatin-like phospholipase/acyl hydrolase
MALTKEYESDGIYRILTLDGGGAKGFYTLGVLKEIEGLLQCPLYKRFDLIFGTSTGSIIGTLLALGHEVDEIHDLYKEYVPTVMRIRDAPGKSAALKLLGDQVFGDKKFDAVKTAVGVVATRWLIERPMIFKGSIDQAHGRHGTFVPGFGVSISEAVQASCSAYPFFERKLVSTAKGDQIELVDGGYCANNPTLYALADALGPLKIRREDIRVINVGVGMYPQPRPRLLSRMWFAQYLQSVQLLQKTLEINTQSMDQLREILFKEVATERISESYTHPEMATDLFEHNLLKLNVLRQRGAESYATREAKLKQFLLPATI